MQRKIIYLLMLLILLFQIFPFKLMELRPVFANDLKETREERREKKEELSEKEEELGTKKEEEATLAYEFSETQGQLSGLQQTYSSNTEELKAKEEALIRLQQEIQEKEEDLKAKERLIAERIRSFYKHTQFSPVISIFLKDNFSSMAEDYIYRMAIVLEDQRILLDLSKEIEDLQLAKSENERLQAELEIAKQQLGEEMAWQEEKMLGLNSQLETNRNTQDQLVQQMVGIQREIKNLTQKEKEILAAKAAAAAAKNTVGNEEVVWQAINEPAPKDGDQYFSFWTYGYPHRVGMNQYGAYGRALAGQAVGTILHAYYANVQISGLDGTASSYNEPDKIKVDGYGWVDFDDYLKGIGEMPSSWPKEALKSQAVAARTYALNYINYASYKNYNEYRNDPNARSICTDQRCQVYLGHPKEASWQQAVEETKGMVLLSGGVPITAWYASTAGGATISSQEAWGGYRSYALGVVDIDGQGRAYDGPSWGGSPWYHKCWGNQPWLSKNQAEDLINAALLPEKYNGHLPSSSNGGFSPEKVVATLKKEGITPVEGLNSIQVGVGHKHSSSFKVKASSGNLSLDPERFRFVYNLRSPGTNAIWTTKFDVQGS